MEDRKFKVFIADGDNSFAENIRKTLSGNNLWDVIIVEDFASFHETVLCEKPDIIIMDIILPGIDGLAFIKQLSSLFGAGRASEVIIVSAFYNERHVKAASDAGVFNYFVKPIPVSVVTDAVKAVYKSSLCGFSNTYAPISKNTFSVIEEPVMFPSVSPSYSSEYGYSQKNIIVKITQLLHDMGIPAHLCGHDYLRDAIMMVMESHEVSGRMTKEIYPEIALKYKKSPQSVERAIRTVLDVAWTRGKTELINDIFRFTVNIQKGRPTNSEFVSLIADYLNYECAV